MTTPRTLQEWEALKKLNADEFLVEAGATLLHKSERGNELYRIRNLFQSYRESYFLRYVCPSTGKIYLKGISWDIGQDEDADLAQAWSFGLTLEEYERLETEA
ncbi:MAG: hypothetical protein ABSH41_23740 [Syntrophobacteraceae bacterium]|jgi:hypothetical protein